jgi:hypothetical protein
MGETYSPSPPPPQSNPPPPAADDCASMPTLNLKNLVDIGLDLDGVAGGGLLPNAQLLRLDLGDSGVAIGNPLLPDCSDQQTETLIDVNGPALPLGIFSEASSTGDLLHVAVDDTTVKVGNPFASASRGEGTSPLIDVNAQNLPLLADSGPDDDGGGMLLAGLLGSDNGATGLLSGLFGSEGGGGHSGGGEDCGCGGILQPVVDLVFDPVDGLLA